jgi:riboflavin synthase
MITSTNNSKKLDILIPSSFGKFVTEKGSIALNGVSLTVNSLKDNDEGCLISVNLVPHTWSKTSFAELKINSKINFEIDLIARNLCRLLQDRKFLTECLNVKK